MPIWPQKKRASKRQPRKRAQDGGSAEQEIAAASEAARRDLTAYAADLAIALAKEQIHVDPGTDSNLVRNFADRLGSAEDGAKTDGFRRQHLSRVCRRGV